MKLGRKLVTALPSHSLALCSHWRGGVSDPQPSRNPSSFLGQLLTAAVMFCSFCKHPPLSCASSCHYCHQQFSAVNGASSQWSRHYTQKAGELHFWTRKTKVTICCPDGEKQGLVTQSTLKEYCSNAPHSRRWKSQSSQAPSLSLWGQGRETAQPGLSHNSRSHASREKEEHRKRIWIESKAQLSFSRRQHPSDRHFPSLVSWQLPQRSLDLQE